MMRKVMFAVCLSMLGCGDDPQVDTEFNPAEMGACTCKLSTQIDNLAVCVSAGGSFGPTQVYSSYVREGQPGPECSVRHDPPTAPVLAWTGLRVSSACAGSGQFCIAVRGGDAANPSADDCTLATRCSQIAYDVPNVAAELAPLASWLAESSECAARYETVGGYLEFALTSEQLGCNVGSVQTKRVQLCPVRCRENPAGVGCEVCGAPQLATTF